MPVARVVSIFASICASVWLRWLSSGLNSGVGRTSPSCGRPRFFELGWGHLSLVLFGRGFTRFNSCEVAADMTDEMLAQGVFDRALMHALYQLAGGKFAKRPAEGGLAWHCKAQIEPAQSAQFSVRLHALHQRTRGL